MSNMKQKIVMKIDMTCDICRSKAMSIATCTDGVDSVSIQGNDMDELVIIGEGVDSSNLAKLLRKKVGYAALVSVQPVTQPPPPVLAPPPPPPPPPIHEYPSYYYPIHPPQFQMREVVYDSYPNNNCPIM